MMSNWGQGWMNTWMTCPDGHGIERGYTAPDAELFGRCLDCGKELEGFRVLTKEKA